jgi:type I restriction-modification system DNA methylase subunit
LDNIQQIERPLWEAADQLLANSKLTSTEYYMPVLGLIFLRHAHTRYLSVKAEIEPKLPKRGSVRRAITRHDFARKAALFLREESQYEFLLSLPLGRNVGEAMNAAMDAIEKDYPNLGGVLKLVDRAEIEANDWSLTPGRYVGVAPHEEDEDFDFEETLRDTHVELAGLNEEAVELAKRIQRNFEELGI